MSHLTPPERITLESYDKSAEAWARARNTKNFWAPEVKRFHELLPAGRILEVGAGHGRDAAELIELGYDYVGTDLSEGLLKVIKARFPDHDFYKQSVYDLNFPEGQKFDGFWAAAVLLHIPKNRMTEALQSLKQALRNRAIGFISLKDGEGEVVEHDEIGGQTMARLFSYWSKTDFMKALEENGYATLDYIYHPMSEKTNWHSFFVRND